MKRNVLLVLMLLAFLFIGMSLFAENEKTESQQLFKAHCAMCHGADGAGNTFIGKKENIPDLRSSQVQKQTDQELSGIIENGKQKMPAFKTQLKPEQVKDLVEYLRELAKSGASAQK